MLLDDALQQRKIYPTRRGRLMTTYLTIKFDEKETAKQEARAAGTHISFDFNKKKWYWEGDEKNLPPVLAKYFVATTPAMKASNNEPDICYSAEQQAVIDAAKQGLSVAVNACAGSGKTRTIVGVADELEKLGKRGHVFYFGAANAKEGREKLPASARCSTFHAKAYWQLDDSFRSRITRVTPAFFAKRFDREHTVVSDALSTIDRFCKSSAEDITRKHFKTNTKTELKPLDVIRVLALAKKIWTEQIKPHSDVPISHGTYLKMWALSHPVLNVDYIMVDEFQDTSPVNIGIIQNHIDAGIQLIVVGDKNQSIFQFTGAVNAFNAIKLEKQLRLTRSFRNGQQIVNLAAKVLNRFAKQKNSNEAFTGLDNGAKICRLTKPQAFISRTNAELIARVLLEVKHNRKAFIVGGADNLYKLIEGCKDLKEGRKTNHSELAVFSDWEELLSYANTDIGSDLKPLVTMIIKRGCTVLLEAIDKMKYTRKAEADIILTTAHKAKGLEFNSVKLAADFRFDKKSNANLNNNDTLTTQGKNLMYVAITRTLGDLDVSEVGYLQPLLKQKNKASI